MTKIVWRRFLPSLVLMGLTYACGDGFEKKKPKRERHQQGQREEADTATINQQYVELVNDHRISLGLTPLLTDLVIEKEAKGHSKGMALRTRPFGHHGFNLRCRRLRNRIGPTKRCGEIVAMGQRTPKEVLKAWLKSESHRQEIENPHHTHTGLGFHKDVHGQIFWTQMFVEL